MRASTIEKIVTSVPANRTAAQVVNEREGEHWSPDLDPHIPHFETPPPMKRVPKSAPQLVGQRLDRLTVLGLYAGEHTNGARWVVRCDCGRYELRRTKALLRRTGEDEQHCARCHHLARVRWRYENLPPRDFKTPTEVNAGEESR